MQLRRRRGRPAHCFRSCVLSDSSLRTPFVSFHVFAQRCCSASYVCSDILRRLDVLLRVCCNQVPTSGSQIRPRCSAIRRADDHLGRCEFGFLEVNVPQTFSVDAPENQPDILVCCSREEITRHLLSRIGRVGFRAYAHPLSKDQVVLHHSFAALALPPLIDTRHSLCPSALQVHMRDARLNSKT